MHIGIHTDTSLISSLETALRASSMEFVELFIERGADTAGKTLLQLLEDHQIRSRQDFDTERDRERDYLKGGN